MQEVENAKNQAMLNNEIAEKLEIIDKLQNDIKNIENSK